MLFITEEYIYAYTSLVMKGKGYRFSSTHLFQHCCTKPLLPAKNLIIHYNGGAPAPWIFIWFVDGVGVVHGVWHGAFRDPNKVILARVISALNASHTTEVLHLPARYRLYQLHTVLPDVWFRSAWRRHERYVGGGLYSLIAAITARASCMGVKFTAEQCQL